MSLPQRYSAAESEPHLQEAWAAAQIYAFDPANPRPIFAIDTPPPTVSGEIHIGHVYSYVQAEAMARFWRMQGHSVYYPFGFDDNGLATERFVERRLGRRARDLGREAFIAACLEISREVENRFETFWRRLGFSVDWRLRYSTIDPLARRTAQWGFLDLYRKGRIYRAQAPNPWCAECQTAIAQAEIEDVERTTRFLTLAFGLADDGAATLPIATTRPELLPACVAVFVHPDDDRYRTLVGRTATTPLDGRGVPILADPLVDPAKGTGAVMCCTFGDSADVAWWRGHSLPLIPLVTRQGRLSEAAGSYAGLTLAEARQAIVADLRERGLLLAEQPVEQTVRVHERCGTPLEIIETSQWFIRLLDAREELLAAGRQLAWHPQHMHTRYEHWVANLSWDWCISRQRFFGVAFPAWHCPQCGAIILADESQLPCDPTVDAPPRGCACGCDELRPDTDVMDTWATSSLSPLIAARMLEDPALAARLLPMALRPQAHDIIRTWAFYTIARSLFHFGRLPWGTLMISGHALDPSGAKYSKSKGNATTDPGALIERYGADAVRYWACRGALGADQPVNEETMRQGGRVVAKLWSAARLIGAQLADGSPDVPREQLLPADRALLSGLQRLIAEATERYRAYDYSAALELTERFFWDALCDNYLELAKGRMYDGAPAERGAALLAASQTLLAVLKLLAPVMPHISEAIYRELFAGHEGCASIHLAPWPEADESLADAEAERAGAALNALAGLARRHKTERRLGLGTALRRLDVAVADPALRAAVEASATDLRSITRARVVELHAAPGAGFAELAPGLWARVEGA